MQPIIVGLIILLATLENSAPLLIDILKTPPGSVFLGTVHHPADYFYYLSQFAQGSYRWLTTVNLYTNEPVPPSFVGWSNVLLGRLFALIGIPHLWAYHLSVIIFTAVFFLVAYRLSLAILGKKWPATLTLFLFAIFHAFPIVRDGALSYADYWNNVAVPTVRLGGVPHQLIIGIVSLLSVLFFIRKRALGLALCGFVLASLQPVLWLLVGLAAVATRSWKNIAVFLTAGAIPALYLWRLFATQPFLQLKLWEAGQQNHLTLWQFMLATGPIFLLTVFFIPRFLSKNEVSKLLIFCFALLSVALFLSPLPSALGFTHVRFMSALTILCLSIIAADGLSALGKPGIAIALGLFFLLLPNHVKTITINTKVDTNNAYYYLPKGDYDLLRRAADISTPEDTFYVIWPFNVVFPGISGRRSFNGHPLLTINAAQKETQAIPSDVSYVISYPITPTPSLLTPILNGGSLIIYKVSL